MRFFEFEAREVVKRAGIPVTDYGFTADPAEAGEIARRIGGPTVIKSQVLTGGRMKAGGVKFADTPAEAEGHARDILALEIGGHMPRGVLVDPKAEVEQEYYAGVVWDGIRKQPVMIFSPVGGIDIEQVAVDLQRQDLARVALGLLGRVRELHAACLHPPAGQHLGLDHRWAADPLGDRPRLGGVGREAVVGYGDAGALDDLARLELKESHAARKPTRLRLV